MPLFHTGTDAAITQSTVMRLLLVAFMVHDLEEIIMMHPWYVRHRKRMQQRCPRIAKLMSTHYDRLSTSSFALAVGEEFVVLATLIFCSVEYGWTAFWIGLCIGYMLHLFVHMAQCIIMRGYVPAVITSFLTVIYCFWAISWVKTRNELSWQYLFPWIAVATGIIVVNFAASILLAEYFERWLRKNYR